MVCLDGGKPYRPMPHSEATNRVFFSRKANLWRSCCYYCFFAYIKIENHSVCFPLSLRLNEPPYDSTCVSTHACMCVYQCFKFFFYFFLSHIRPQTIKHQQHNICQTHKDTQSCTHDHLLIWLKYQLIYFISPSLLIQGQPV